MRTIIKKQFFIFNVFPFAQCAPHKVDSFSKSCWFIRRFAHHSRIRFPVRLSSNRFKHCRTLMGGFLSCPLIRSSNVLLSRPKVSSLLIVGYSKVRVLCANITVNPLDTIVWVLRFTGNKYVVGHWNRFGNRVAEIEPSPHTGKLVRDENPSFGPRCYLKLFDDEAELFL